MDLNFVKDLYLFELEERHREDARVVSQVTVLALIAGALVFALRIWTPRAGLITWSILVLLAVGIGLFVAAIYNLIRAQVGGLLYSNIPYLAEFAALREQLQDYAEANPQAGG